VKFMATKKGMTTIFFSPLSFVAVFGSGVGDPGWVKIRIRDVYPGSRTLIFTHPGSRIPDPKQHQKRGVKKFVVIHNSLCSHKFHKIVNYLSFEMLKKKIWANFQRILALFTQKLSPSSKIWVWDPRSGIRKKPIPDPGSRGQKCTGSATLLVTSTDPDSAPAPDTSIIKQKY
jgi:hypothetical protein